LVHLINGFRECLFLVVHDWLVLAAGYHPADVVNVGFPVL